MRTERTPGPRPIARPAPTPSLGLPLTPSVRARHAVEAAVGFIGDDGPLVGRARAMPIAANGTATRIAAMGTAESGGIARTQNDATSTGAADGSISAAADPTGHRSTPTRRQVASVVLCHLDPISGPEVRGWAYDSHAYRVPVTLDVLIDGEFYRAVVCNLERPDVAAVGHPTAIAGFAVELAKLYYDGRDHVVEARLRPDDQRPLRISHIKGAAQRTFNLPVQVDLGCVDGLHAGAIRGWVFRHDRVNDTKTGGLPVLVSMQGNPIAQIAAREFRPDVAAAQGCDPNCGFAFFPPPDLVAGRTVELEFRVIPGGCALGNSPLRVNFPSPETTAAIRCLSEAADKVSAELWLLRNRLRELTIDRTYSLENYDAWARQYREALSAAPDQLEGLLPADTAAPLISIICPVYKPRLADFQAAVGSVQAQSYLHWEMILVDDASQSPELTACIAALAQGDRRIKALALKINKGISGATNAALARAKGTYVAFLDHDDLLEERALEFMLAAALRTGAMLLYSDEDKIDDAGCFLEPNLKPDWNYRLLLSINYICHFLMVERSQLAKAGTFRSKHNGAQDHDMVLRLSETIPPDRIAHVPEVLYHWRKTPTSTAASGKSKQYSVAAGVQAIQDHLARKGLMGSVHPPRDTNGRDATWFEIDWQIAHEPSVTIIIPYRDHMEMTRACLEALSANTDYRNYRTVLVDNFSTSDEALAFAAEMKQRENISVMRVEESFNFSRLNNLAVARSRSELLLFLNNDVIVSDPAWLRAMVGEMLADPRVGIVGNKLLYPNGQVQHGGVILGVGGVADHAHKGLRGDDPGYVVRAVTAQDLSCVTAACMLCRRSVFEEVGGFDEKDLTVAFNDVDLCIKVGQAGYRLIWTPMSKAEHRESYSRGDDIRPEKLARFSYEFETMVARWGKVLANDRFYHRAFSRQAGMFSDLAAPTVAEATRNAAPPLATTSVKKN